MAKLTLSNVSNFQDNSTAVTTTTANNDAIETAMENTLSRDGTSPNAMAANLDMNSYKIINLAAPVSGSDAVTKTYADATVSQAKQYATDAKTAADEAAADAAAAATSASNASTSASNAATSASNAATSASNAATSETNAAASATSASNASAAASAVALPFTFDSSTSMADPGTGDFRFNNATVGSVTAIALSALTADSGNPDLSDFIATFDDSTNTVKSYLIFRKRGTPATFAVFSVSAVTDNTSWLQLTVSHVASSGSWFASDVAYMAYSRVGDAGAGSGDMLAANNLSDVANAATAFGNIKQSATDTATGVVELATIAETTTGTDTVRAVTPAGVKAVGDLKLAIANNLSDVANAATAFGNIKQAASESATGVVELATTAEAAAGVDTSRAVTPAGVASAIAALASGDYVLIESQTVSGASQVDFVTGISSTYDEYEIHYDLDCSADADLYFRVSTNGGSSYLAGTEYQWLGVQSVTSSPGTITGNAATGAAQIALTETSLAIDGDGATSSVYGKITIMRPANTTYYKKIMHHSVHPNSTAVHLADFIGSGCIQTTSAVNGFRIIPDTGTVTGVARLYARSNS